MKIQFDYYDEAKERIKARYATTDDGKLWIGPFEEYFENGQLKRKGQYTDKTINENESVFYNEEKRRVGDYIEYYENGQIKRQCSYSKDGVLNGADIGYTYDGKRHTLITYTYGVKNGPFETHTYGRLGYARYGWTKEKGVYNREKLEGLYERFYEYDNQMTQTEYEYCGHSKDPKEIMPMYFKFEYKCEMHEGKRHGNFEGFKEATKAWENNQSQFSHDPYGSTLLWTRCHYENDQLEGHYQSFFVNGQVAEDCSFHNNKIEGPYLLSYPDGVFHIKGNYKDGKRVGRFEINENGTILKVCYNENGQKDGVATYFEFGKSQPYGHETYKNGELNGEFAFYSPRTGRILRHGTYIAGKLDGIYEAFNEDGSIAERKLYNQGVIVSDYTKAEQETIKTIRNKKFEQKVHDFMAQQSAHTRV